MTVTRWLRRMLRIPGVVAHKGVLLDVSLPVFSPKIRRSIFRGKYERNEVLSAAEIIKPGDTVLELGSGCGFLSCALAKLRPDATIYCVEANPDLIPVIRLHHQLNGVKASIHNEIVGTSNGEADFFVQSDFWASSALGGAGRKLKVKATRLSDRLNEWRPDVVIMDIEGGELALLDCELPPFVRTLMVEMHESRIGHAAVQQIVDYLRAQGFERICSPSTKDKVATFARAHPIATVN